MSFHIIFLFFIACGPPGVEANKFKTYYRRLYFSTVGGTIPTRYLCWFLQTTNICLLLFFDNPNKRDTIATAHWSIIHTHCRISHCWRRVQFKVPLRWGSLLLNSWNQAKIAFSNFFLYVFHFILFAFCKCGGDIVVIFMLSLISNFF
jgi:hypothetical protein